MNFFFVKFIFNGKLRILLCCLLVIPALLLYGCTQQKDGPPRRHVDASGIPNAVPRPEPQSRQGNMSSYEVFGKRYHVLPHSKDYKEIGGASWYGRKFHGRLTSNGETYDMFAMTAAHKTLPLPTYAKVTNLKNKKSIVVRINDRGPFHGDRIIDLSYVAAKKLGIYAHGTAHVQVEALNHSAQPSDNREKSLSQAQAQFSNHPIYLQVGAFSSRDNAHKLLSRVKELGHPAKLKYHQHPSNLFKVQVGPLSPAQAQKTRQILMAHGLTDGMSIISKPPQS